MKIITSISDERMKVKWDKVCDSLGVNECRYIFILNYYHVHQWTFIKFYVVVRSLSCVWHFVTPWTVARQASLSFTVSQSLLKLMSIESLMASNHLILCHPLLLLPSIFASIRVFSNESALCIRWPKYWILCFHDSPSN